ncbi:aldose epimerase [Flavobacterium aquatile LMG 4008 = ATCC 11947]|uniref:Aldose 1-epimerase n=1 Tax=Flavobacterium aquatile LMG 4008 = ATCC 11947 TaxID=1453498 RepID=A0A095U389_9FLAO|nr:aldose epimerase [Flavobacterium aquatile LMG 4008 = ATCC 11947]
METPVFSKFFGNLPDGNEVLLFTLCNKNGAELSVMNYGATITSLKIPISETKKVDVVLGFDTLDDYINSFDLPSAPYFGTTVGRFAGRINNAQFSLNDKKIQLNKNHGSHNIHGGNDGFSRKFWKLISSAENDNPSITFQYISENNEENFPGKLTANVTYTLTDSNELIVDYSAISTEDTVINCTQHSYFNLDDQADTIANQTLFVNSKQILETTSENIPTGNFVNLENHKFDFLNPKNAPNQIDNTFVLEHNNEVKAWLFSEKNNLKMSVFTSQPAVHIYVGGNCFNQIKGKENANYHAQSGICFETQNYPDAPNHRHFPSAVLRKGETYHHKTTFKFENI